MARVGIVADLHLPFTHPMYYNFVCDTFEAWDVDRVVFIGDIFDNHALSFWEHDPDGMSAGDETKTGRDAVRRWHQTWRNPAVLVGNHDERHFRQARRSGIPRIFMRPFNEVWGTPGWKWHEEVSIDGVVYEHGTGTSGKNGAYNRAVQHRSSLVMGHIHAYAGVTWNANRWNTIFGLNVGCGIDIRAYAAAYAKPFAIRPVLGCGVVIDGECPYFEPMLCGKGQPYHRSRAA